MKLTLVIHVHTENTLQEVKSIRILGEPKRNEESFFRTAESISI